MAKGLPWERLLLAVLLLGSCGDSAPTAFTQAHARRLDSVEINVRNAARASRETADRFERLETRLQALELR